MFVLSCEFLFTLFTHLLFLFKNFINVAIRFLLTCNFFVTLCTLVLFLMNFINVAIMFALSCEFFVTLCTHLLYLFMNFIDMIRPKLGHVCENPANIQPFILNPPQIGPSMWISNKKTNLISNPPQIGPCM